jgi:pyrroloquinoline quinone biosynthesis protein D
MHDDRVRGKTVLLAPERVIHLDAIGLAILQQIDGEKTMTQIIEALAALYAAPVAQISEDVSGYVAGLMDRRILEIRP